MVKRRMRVRLLIREVCESRGVSRTRLARLSEMQYDTIQGIWMNPYRDVSITTLVKIAHGLRVPVDTLYTVVEDEG